MAKDCIAYTDGSVRPRNPGHGASAAVLQWGDKVVVHAKYLGPRVTNNIAELEAIELAVDYYLEHLSDDFYALVIYTDSEYCIGVLAGTWNITKNKPLIKRIKEKLIARVSFEWVRGHSGDAWNTFVDVLARKVAGDQGYPGCQQEYDRPEFLKYANDFLQKELSK